MEQFQSNEPATIRITKGKLVQSVRVKFRGIDVVTTLGGSNADVDLSDDHLSIVSTVSTDSNQELICSFSSPAPSFETHQREFFTNSGVDWIRRMSKNGMEAQNFYPMVLGARMASRKTSTTFTVITSHSMAVGSQTDGTLELMMHRSLAQDDGRGLSEAVHDNSRLDIPLWLSFGTVTTTQMQCAVARRGVWVCERALIGLVFFYYSFFFR